MRTHAAPTIWPNGYQTRTFRYGPTLLEDFYALAERLALNPSDLVCYLLRAAVDQVQAGELQVPTRPIGAVIDDPRARE